MPRTGASWKVEVGGQEVIVTHPQRLLWPQEGLTKAQLVQYYLAVAPLMLPHLAGRPLVLTRYPQGIHGPSFYQKDCPQGAPPWVRTVPVAHGDRTVRYVLAEGPAVLAWLGNLAAIEVHPWLSRAERPDSPDWMVIDLDPDPPSGFEEARRVAFVVRELLERLGLQGVPKLSGATGIHIYVPLVPGAHTYRETSQFVALLGRILAQVLPGQVTAERPVHRRGGKVYVDPYQNLRGKTLVGPYSPRPRPGAPVAVPVTWEELGAARPEDFTIGNAGTWLARRLADRTDPLLEVSKNPQRLDAALRYACPRLR